MNHENIEAIQTAVTIELTAIPKEVFTSCFQELTAEGTTLKGTGTIN
jgi:hypothetical protein